MPDHHLQEAFQGKEATPLHQNQFPLAEVEEQEAKNPMVAVGQDSRWGLNSKAMVEEVQASLNLQAVESPEDR